MHVDENMENLRCQRARFGECVFWRNLISAFYPWRCVGVATLLNCTPLLRVTSHTRLRARDHFNSSTLIGGKGGAGSKFATSHCAWGTNGVSECKMDVKVYIDSYMTLNGACFTVPWTAFENHLLEVGLTQNRPGRPWYFEHSQPLVCSILSCVRTRMNRNSIETTFGWGLGHIRLHTTLEGPWPHYVILEVSWDGLCTLSFGLSQFRGHVSWRVCELALSRTWRDLQSSMDTKKTHVTKRSDHLLKTKNVMLGAIMNIIKSIHVRT